MGEDLDQTRDRIGRMTEDELQAAAAADPLALAGAYAAKADQMEADAAMQTPPPPGVRESVAVMRQKAAELRATAGNTATE